MATNNFLPFCPTDTGTNLLSQGDYAAAPHRDIGNQPGVASSKLVNKAIRQSAYISSQVAQYLGDKTGSDLLDDATPERLLAQINAAILPLPPTISRLTSGSGNWNRSVYFFIASGSATAGATYTNNSVTFTVSETVASGTLIRMTGNGNPTVSGTLTKTGGTGDATLSFYARRLPLSLLVDMVGGGGGGGSSGTAAVSNGGNGGTSTFGTASCNGGVGGGGGGVGGGIGGSVTPSYDLILAVTGQRGSGMNGTNSATFQGGNGGSTAFGPGGSGVNAQDGETPSANTGGGGGGGGTTATPGGCGGGGGGGGSLKFSIPNPLSTYSYAVGAAGTGTSAGTNGMGGAAGAAGAILLQEQWQ